MVRVRRRTAESSSDSHAFCLSSATPGLGERFGSAAKPEFYRVTLSRATGIDWASDLSFRWVYVRGVEPGSSAALAGVKAKHQLVELRVAKEDLDPKRNTTAEEDDEAGLLVGAGAAFPEVMSALASLPPGARRVDLTLFSGSKAQLKQALLEAANIQPSVETDTINIEVNQGDKSLGSITAPKGANLRDVLIGQGINVYRSVARWSNCNGQQLCGTCIVDVHGNPEQCSAKSLDEASTLRENPDTYRLSCVTFVYGDIKVEVLPPKVTAAQWTR
eukprot:scaffold266_cov248-Pinguiococcus_pyrenoidosus.AAC.20